ncbi:MAG: Gfo/Idh/MocA family oxidoreductase [Phycisphaeraceae bacterium]
MAGKLIRIGVIGAGNNTRRMHLPKFAALADVQIAGVCNRSTESSRRVAQQFNIARTYEHWMQVIEDPDIDAVMIGTWPYLHAPATLAALASGKHVLCEARMAMDASEAHQMLDAARAHPELIAQIVPSPFTLPVDATIRKLLAQDAIGQVLAVEVRDTAAWINRDAPLSWRQDTDLSGANILSLGIWYEALLRWVGPAVRVLALGRTFVKERADGEGLRRAVAVPDHVDVAAELACGAQLHMQISAVMGLPEQSGVWLCGSQGTLKIALPEVTLYRRQREEKEYAAVDLPAELVGGWRVEEEFVAAIRGQEQVKLTDLATGVRYMEFTQAVTRSMQTGQAIALPL